MTIQVLFAIMDFSFPQSSLHKAIDVLKDIESVGEEIIYSQEQIVDFDKKRNKNREALGQIGKSENKKTWLCFSNMFIRVENVKAVDIIKRDQQQLNQNIESFRDDLKIKMSKIRSLEGKTMEQGFDLKPISKNEAQALRNILPKTI